MALLALVAAAGRRGISRERILGILWADTAEEQARHTLSQNLYTLRRETGRNWIVANPALRLDPSITADVVDFEAALAEPDFARAAALYTGTFLEGFYLPGAPEFERWVEEERSRLRAAAMRALETLASQAADAGSHAEAINAWRRLAELDPFSARHAVGLIRAFAAAGDQGSALAHAQRHEQHLRKELGTDIDPAVRQLVATLRVTPRERAPAIDRPVAPVARPAAPNPRRRGLMASAGVVGVAVGVGVGVAAIALVGRLIWPSKPAAPPRPFLAVGTIRATDTAAAGPVLRDMLATNLGNINGLQVVSNSRLLELMPRGAESMATAITDAARRAGATEVIEGEVMAAPVPDGLVLTLRRVALATGVVRRGYTIRAGDRYALVDSATAAIARDLHLTPPQEAVASIRTTSATAYALYEEGLRAYYKYDTPAAYRLMSAALERDSTFAMAAFYAWQASRSWGSRAGSDRVLRLAKSLAGKATERERLLIEGSVASLEASVDDYLAIADTLTERYPNDPDGQILLGMARFGAGDWAGSVAAHERAVAIDSVAGVTAGAFCRICEALAAMSHAYLWWDSAGAAERTARRLIALRPDEGTAWGNLAEPLLRQGRRAEAEAAIERVIQISVSRPTPPLVLNRDRIRWGEFEQLEPELRSELASVSPERRSDARWLMLLSLRNQGRLRQARDLALRGEVAWSATPLSGFEPDLTNLAIIAFELGQPNEAARRFRELAERDLTGDAPPGFKARTLSWHLTLAGTALAAARDTAAVRRLADSVEQVARGSSFGRDPKLHYFLRGLLLQYQDRHSEAVVAFRRSLFSVTDGYTRTNLEMARSLMILGRPAEAIAVLQPALRGGVDGSNTYVTHTELHEALGQAFEQAGRRDSAAAHYQAVERAWRWANPEFGDRYRAAKFAAAKR